MAFWPDGERGVGVTVGSADLPDRTRLTLRQRNKLRTRQEFLDAALKVFVEMGYGSATVEAIAAEAGASKVTLYSYFPGGRDDLFREIYVQVNDRLLEEGSAVYARSEGTYVDRVLSLMTILMDVASTPRIGRFYAIDDPALKMALTPVRGHASRVWTDLIATDLAEARRDGQLTIDADPGALAVLLVGCTREALTAVSQHRARVRAVCIAFEALVRAL